MNWRLYIHHAFSVIYHVKGVISPRLASMSRRSGRSSPCEASPRLGLWRSLGIAGFIWAAGLSLTAEADGIKYLLNCYTNDNLTPEEIALTLNPFVLANGGWQPIPGAGVWYPGQGTNLVTLVAGSYDIYFKRIQDFYVPVTQNQTVAPGSSLGYTNSYHIYSNSLSVLVTGITTSASATWQLTAYPPNEYTNSSFYSAHSSGLFTNTSPLYSNLLSTIPTGTYSMTFNSVRGHHTPPAASVIITGAPYAWSTNITYVPYSNSLTVVVTNRGTNNVIWTLLPTGYPPDYTNALPTGYSFTNNYTLTMIPTGSYTVTFPSLGTYYTTAAAITTNIVGALTPTVTGAYARIMGNLEISILPPAAASNATWNLITYPLDGFYTNLTFGTGNTTLYNVPIGFYEVKFNYLDGYITPTNVTTTVLANSTVTVNGDYTFNGHTLVVHIQAPFARQQSLEGIGSGPCRVAFTGTTYDQTIIEKSYSVIDDEVVNLTALTNYVYKWYINRNGLTTAGINGTALWTNNISFVMDSDKAVWLLYSTPYNEYEPVGDIDHDLLPDVWEVRYFGDGGNTEAAAAPQAESFTNQLSNPDKDFVPNVLTNSPVQISMDTNNGFVTITGLGGAIPGYPLQRNRLLTSLEVPSPSGTYLGYSTGYGFNNLLECRGFDGYYLTNGPNGWIYSDDPMTNPNNPDTDADNLTDGWEYYFWYWRSADAYTAGMTNSSANLSWVTFNPTVWNMPDWDTDNDGLYDQEEHDDTWTDPTHCDTDGDGMDDYWEIYNILPTVNSNALDYANALLNPDGDYMAQVPDLVLTRGVSLDGSGVLTNATRGMAYGTNACWFGGTISNPTAVWLEFYTNTGNNIFDLYLDPVLRASSALTNGTLGTRYAHTNYYVPTVAGGVWKPGYPFWIDWDDSGTNYFGPTNDVPIVNPNIKHDGVYRMPPALPLPGVCMFDPRTAWTNIEVSIDGIPRFAPNTIEYTTIYEYLGADYVGRLSWDAGGQRSYINDDAFALTRISYSNPQSQDTDADLMPDGWELYTGLNDNSAGDASTDSDLDGLSNAREWANANHALNSCAATWPNKPWPTDPGFITAPAPNDPHPRDTDFDGLLDGNGSKTEVDAIPELGEHDFLSNPTDCDTDTDGLPDGWEVYGGTSITNSDANMDADFDGLYNWQEYWTGTVPEWMECDPDWGMLFLARRYMKWNPPYIDDPGTDDPYEPNIPQTHFGQVNVDTRWFMPPDFITCPSFLYGNWALESEGIDRAGQASWLRTNGFAAASSERYPYGHTTVATNSTDADTDAMDDFWEVFHCLNPIRGYNDKNFGWPTAIYAPYLRVGLTDADPETPGNQVGTAGNPFANVMDLVYYIKDFRSATTFNIVPPQLDPKYSYVVNLIGPHNFGLEGMDPDNDGLTSFDEYQYYRAARLLHTCPAPLWRNDPSLGGPYGFVLRNYTRDNTAISGGFNTLGFSHITYRYSDDPSAEGRPFRWAAMTEGFDTDNDLLGDWDEVTGYRTNGVISATDPLFDESPLKNRVVWLDGTNSWLRSYCWSPYGDWTKFSVEAWARPSRLKSTYDQVILEKTSLHAYQNPDGSFGSSALANVQLGISSNGLPYVLFHDITGLNTHRALATDLGLLKVNQWVHLAGVFDGTRLIIYVNGEASATHYTIDVPARGVEGDYVWHANCNLSIGARELIPGWHYPRVGWNFFAGSIDEVRFWDRVLSVGEIKARKNRRLTPAEIGLIQPGNAGYVEGANSLFAYFRFTDLPDPNLPYPDGKVPRGFPGNQPDRPLSSRNYSYIYTNYIMIAKNLVRRIPCMPPRDTRVIDGTPVSTSTSTNGPDEYGISTTNYLGITNNIPADFRNTSNPYNFTHAMYNIDMGRGCWLVGNAQGLKGTNTWLPTLDPNDPDSSDSDGDGLPDWWEQLYGLDINDATGDNGAWGDPDNDGLNNHAEYLAGTSPRNSDTDNDGIGDYDSRGGPYSRTWGEMYSDGDGMPDVWEMQYGLDPYHYDANLDLDGDGWSNLAEYLAGTNPNDVTSLPQPTLWGTAGYFGDKSELLNFYVYNTNTMDGTPKTTKTGTDTRISTILGTADGTFYFDGRLPVYPLDVATVVTLSAPLGGTNFVTFIFTGPNQYTYAGPGTDFAAGVDYNTGWVSLRWATIGVPPAGRSVSVDYNYVNRNAAAFSIQGFKEGDFYLLATMNDVIDLDASKPMGIMEDQPLTMGYSDLTGVRVHLKDSATGYGRFGWTGVTTVTSDYPVIINKISESGGPTVLTRSMRWPRNIFHEWDYQIAGLYGLPNGQYQWWMTSQQGTFSISWPASVSTPTLVYPRGNQINYAVNQFKWTMDVNSTMYHLQVARQASDGGLAFVLDQYYPTPYCDQDGVSQANLPLYAGELGDGIYYWRVASWSPAGESAWAEPQTFAINLSATNSHWLAGDIYYFGKADCENIIVEAFDNRGFSGKPEARVLLTGAVRSNSFKGSFTLRGLEEGTYYIRAYLDVTPAGGTRDGKLNKPWESSGFVRDPNNDYQPRIILLSGTMFVDGMKLVIRDNDTDNDLMPDAWEMYYFGNLDQTGDMDYDGDGETNLEEYMRDGVDMNPAIWDTDGDGLSDAFEINYTAPSFGYSAKSGMQLNPMLWDTDGDGYSDGAEMKRYHTDPLDPTSYPRYQPMCFDAFRSPGDYDGDGRSDLSVYDIVNGNWYVMTAAGQFGNLPFGSSATQPMLGDYDGDGCDDFAVFEPATGAWNLYNAWTGQSFRLNFGDSEMIPVPADYDGDNKTDLAVYYPADGMWYIYSVWSGQFYSLKFGGPTCVPVPGDYNNDGAGDLATYEPNTGNWNIFTFDHYRFEGKYFSGNFGGPTMLPAGGDYDGDGRNDAALFEPSTGYWYILTWRGQFLSGQFGGYGCIPAPGDYDGDGRTDVCVYYPPTGTWYIYCWSGQTYQVQFGFASATPALKGR